MADDGAGHRRLVRIAVVVEQIASVRIVDEPVVVVVDAVRRIVGIRPQVVHDGFVGRVDTRIEHRDRDFVAAVGKRVREIDAERLQRVAIHLRREHETRIRFVDRIDDFWIVVREPGRLMPANDAVRARLLDRRVLAQLSERAAQTPRLQSVRVRPSNPLDEFGVVAVDDALDRAPGFERDDDLALGTAVVGERAEWRKHHRGDCKT